MRTIILIICLMVFTVHGPAFAETIGRTNEEVSTIANPIIDNILTEMSTGNYENFSKDFDSNMKKFLNKDKFQTDTKKISDEIGKYISKEYLGYFNKGEMTMVIWKGKFDKTGDDVLIKVVLSKSGDKNYITGLWFE